MKILVVSQYFFPEPFRIDEICFELKSRGHELTVLTSVPSYPYGKVYEGYNNCNYIEDINGIKVYRCKCFPKRKGIFHLLFNYLSFVKHSKKTIKSLCRERFDCIYVYQLSPVSMAIPAIKISQNTSTPIVLYCLDIWPESIRGKISAKGLVFWLVKKFSIKIYNSVKTLLVTSPSFIEYFKDLGVIPHAAYLPQHSQDVLRLTIDKNDPKADTKDPKTINFMFLGNIGSSQNLPMVIKSFYKCRKNNYIFHIVGSGSEYDLVERTIRDLRMTDCCILYGRQPKERMAFFYRIADVCVLSLKKEGRVSNTIPGKLQEYMSAGKFIVASIDGDASDLITNVNCGLVSKCGDVEGLARNIEKVINKEVDIIEGGKKARDYYENNFTLKDHVDYLEKRMIENCG